jgi:hypothetical protein
VSGNSPKVVAVPKTFNNRPVAEQMPSRVITLSEDEIFHAQIRMVAIESASNLTLVEQCQPQRDAESWQ